MSNEPRPERSLIDEATDEARDMAKQGMAHPSTKPVLIGLGVGAVAGAILPVVTLPVGAIAGGLIAFYRRLKR